MITAASPEQVRVRVNVTEVPLTERGVYEVFEALPFAELIGLGQLEVLVTEKLLGAVLVPVSPSLPLALYVCVGDPGLRSGGFRYCWALALDEAVS